MFLYTALPYLLLYAVRQCQPPLPCRPLHLPHPSVQCFGMTGTPVMEKVQSPLRGHRTFSCLSERVLRSNTFHYIPLLYTPHPFGRSRKKAVGRADSTLSAKSGMAEAMDKKVVRLLCRARPTGALPFYPSPLPHYRPMGRAARGRSMSGVSGRWWCSLVAVGSVSIPKVPHIKPKPSLSLANSATSASIP